MLNTFCPPESNIGPQIFRVGNLSMTNCGESDIAIAFQLSDYNGQWQSIQRVFQVNDTC